MGGHAFRYLHCPRIPHELYLQVRSQTTHALRSVFKDVVVPAELPSKSTYGDIDFLVSNFVLDSPDTSLDWQRMLATIKDVFGTLHGKRGFLNPDVMYFAIPSPGEEHVWIQIDVKVCEARDEESFAWEHFQLNYASGLKMMGSLLKPLGLTIDPKGLHVRVEEMEATDFPGSLVFVTKKPMEVLRLLRLDKRFLNEGFESTQDIYRSFASSWVFNPAHFEARLAEDKYRDHLEDRSEAWVSFVTEWIPQQYPGYRFLDQDVSLDEWRKQTRATMREKVFTSFPAITPEYYTKRGAHLREVEEHRLQELLMAAIPMGMDGWRRDMSQPTIIIEDVAPSTSELKPTVADQTTPKCTPQHQGSPLASLDLPTTIEYPPTPPTTPPPQVGPTRIYTNQNDPQSTPVYLRSLPRTPDRPFSAQPTPEAMHPSAKLRCLARWTLFDPQTDTPYLARSPRDKNFEMRWSDSGAGDEVLLRWVREMWWVVWVRQARVNYGGMWRRRFEREAAEEEREGIGEKGEMVRVEGEQRKEEGKEKDKMEVEVMRRKILERLSAVNECRVDSSHG